jgi:hypothetical protein
MLAKETQLIEQKATTVYFAIPDSQKFMRQGMIEELAERYRKYLAEANPEMLQEVASTSPRKRKLTDAQILKTPAHKKPKLSATSGTSSLEASFSSARMSDQTARKPLPLQAARKGVPAPRLSPDNSELETTLKMTVSAIRMKASNDRGRPSYDQNTTTDGRSLLASVIEDSTLELARELSGESVSRSRFMTYEENDQPQAQIRDPLDDLLESSKKPTADQQELLDLMSGLCAQEAASDAARFAQKNFEVTDFFAHWPEYLPSEELVDRKRKIEEIKKRPNRRQMLGRPYRRPDPLVIYRPYAELKVSPTQSEGENTPIEARLPRYLSSNKKNISPRKRGKGKMDDSVIGAFDPEINALLEIDTTVVETKKVDSWQEALGLPRELVPGFVTDFGTRKGRKLVMEVPLAVRGKTRNWFKAPLPED